MSTIDPALVAKELRVLGDERGSLVALEAARDVPFSIARVYYIFGTQAGALQISGVCESPEQDW